MSVLSRMIAPKIAFSDSGLLACPRSPRRQRGHVALPTLELSSRRVSLDLFVSSFASRCLTLSFCLESFHINFHPAFAQNTHGQFDGHIAMQAYGYRVIAKALDGLAQDYAPAIDFVTPIFQSVRDVH